MSAEFERLAIDLELMPADPSPCCVGHDVLDFGDQKFEHAPSAGNRWRLCVARPGPPPLSLMMLKTTQNEKRPSGFSGFALFTRKSEQTI